MLATPLQSVNSPILESWRGRPCPYSQPAARYTASPAERRPHAFTECPGIPSCRWYGLSCPSRVDTSNLTLNHAPFNEILETSAATSLHPPGAPSRFCLSPFCQGSRMTRAAWKSRRLHICPPFAQPKSLPTFRPSRKHRLTMRSNRQPKPQTGQPPATSLIQESKFHSFSSS